MICPIFYQNLTRIKFFWSLFNPGPLTVKNVNWNVYSTCSLTVLINSGDLANIGLSEHFFSVKDLCTSLPNLKYRRRCSFTSPVHYLAGVNNKSTIHVRNKRLYRCSRHYRKTCKKSVRPASRPSAQARVLASNWSPS